MAAKCVEKCYRSGPKDKRSERLYKHRPAIYLLPQPKKSAVTPGTDAEEKDSQLQQPCIPYEKHKAMPNVSSLSLW